MSRVAVIGGGFTGLACATECIRRGDEVFLFEREPRLGGLAAGFQEQGWKSSLEIAYHHWFASDKFVREYAQLWGVDDKIVFRRPLTVMETTQGQFRPLDSPVALLQFPDLSFFQAFRMGLVLAWLRVTASWEGLEPHSADEWCRRMMGNEGFETIWQPLLVGKFGSEHARQVNMAWLWARLHSRTPQLGTFQGGFARYVDAAESWLRAKGARIHAGITLSRVTRTPQGKWLVAGNSSDELEADQVVVAAPPGALQALVPDLSPAARASCCQQESLGALVVLFTMRRPLQQNGPYWYSLRKGPERPFLAVIDHSQFVPADEFGGEHPVYVADYVPTSGADWKRSDEDLRQRALDALRRITPDLGSDDVVRVWVFRFAHAQPIPRPNASASLPPIAVPDAPGLFHASLAHVYPWDRGTNFALELGRRVADLLHAKP